MLIPKAAFPRSSNKLSESWIEELMRNSVNQETLISPNFLLMEAFKWVVEVIEKVWLGRSFHLPKRVSG